LAAGKGFGETDVDGVDVHDISENCAHEFFSSSCRKNIQFQQWLDPELLLARFSRDEGTSRRYSKSLTKSRSV